jgi:hypothetical protein
MVKLKDKLAYIANMKKVTLEELHSLIGFLKFAFAVVTPGRAYLRRIIDLAIGLKKKPHHFTILSSGNLIFIFSEPSSSPKKIIAVVGKAVFSCLISKPISVNKSKKLDIDLAIGLKKKTHHRRRLSKEARSDIKAWFIFVDSFNGKGLFLSDTWEYICSSTDCPIFQWQLQ